MTAAPAEPTPRSDALLLEINEGRTYGDDGPIAHLARTLERDNATLREALGVIAVEAMQEHWHEVVDLCHGIKVVFPDGAPVAALTAEPKP